MQCPDCDSVRILENRGNGVCSVCHGRGVGGLMDEIADEMNPFGRGHISYYNCGGNGQCPTCGGTGLVGG